MAEGKVSQSETIVTRVERLEQVGRRASQQQYERGRMVLQCT